MNAYGNILAGIPLFRHCNDEEIAQLLAIGKPAEVKRGHLFDMKKVNSFNVIINGIFEIESMGNTDVVYLSPGSFFGTVPFTENRQNGKVRALVDSTLMMFGIEDLYRFFLLSYKCLRGYLKIIGRTGFEVSDVGKKYFGGATRIITVYSPFKQSGKSFLASLLGISLKKSGKTIMLDMSLSGSGLFDFFERKAPAPLSHRTEDSPAFEQLINERIESIDDGLDLFNVTFGSKVAVDPGIISPLLFMLSKEYRYIIIDCGDEDGSLRDRAFALSDRIFATVKNKKDISSLYDVFDAQISEGQRIYYILNERYSGASPGFSGGLTLPRFDVSSESGEFARLNLCAGGEGVAPIVALITQKRRALILETDLLHSLFYGGFLASLHASGDLYDLYYASAYSYIVLALYVHSGGRNEFKKRLEQFFSPERFNKLLDIAFPTDFIFKQSAVSKLAAELFGDSRVEVFTGLPVAMLGRDGISARRLFSTGYFRDLAAASFCLYPVFEQVGIAGGRYNAGYPDYRVRHEDLLRVDADELAYVSVNNSAEMGYRDSKPIGFFQQYMEAADARKKDGAVSGLSDYKYVLDVSEKDVRLDRIFETSQELSDSLIKKAVR